MLLRVASWEEYYTLFDKVVGFVGVSCVFFPSVKSYLNSCVQQLTIDILLQNIQSQREP